ncbi:hypothetical protein N7492_010332 [Penicillium capsulatum]|uniref:Uncharacterized protein n=1 Tax=Penicillium capsulatum TaxID=69766 RepID=A0A9W9HP13_9EURO|nr:hypothetical protein N7492_010332 [Penicillium capsulatum]KAJ6112837.1 hypothetical protein N7512_008161 [Penicillium capsulatum]
MPSLTLTDPDMILPYDGSERESSTPSPPSQLVYLSNLNARYNSADPQAGSNAPRPKKNFSRHAWNTEEGSSNRRLSDIGEELSPARIGGFDDEPARASPQVLASSPVLPEYTAPETKENVAWSSSNSTVSAGSHQPSREVTSPQNVNNVNNTATPAPVEPAPISSEDEVKPGIPDSSVIASAAKGKGPGDEFSSAILSSEAERILENAKKRLTLMEGNLSRARSSVRLTPSPSPSAPGNIQPMGPYQPVGGLYRSISRSERRNSTLRRQPFAPSHETSVNRHSRVHSDTNFPAESNLSSDTKKLSRSVSAMGASTSSHFNHDDRSFHYEPTRSYLTHRASISSMKPASEIAPSPQPLHSPLPEEESPTSPTGLGISPEEVKSMPGDLSPVYSSYGPPSRAQSQLQVRDLQYQMKGLHIKISSLKVRSQEDNLRRRSLQSLRTPSPLTAADPWFSNALEMKDGRSSRGSTAIRDASSEYAREPRSSNELAPVKDHESEQVDNNAVQQASESLSKQTGTAWNTPPVGYENGRESVAESMYEDAEEGDFEDGDIDREALDEILREPLDDDLESNYHNADETPHEEREDAFDYEHFILHSALGNYSRQLRRASNSSRESAETTRPGRPARHSRNDSSMSTSTVATFATATEGEEMPEAEDDIDDVLYWDRRFNHELRHRHAHNNQPSATIETDRAETPRGNRDESGTATPVEGQPTSPGIDHTGRSSSATAGSATPTSLVSSLVSTVRAASSPHPGSATPTSGGINDDDTQILEQLFASLGNVCMGLQAITTSPDPDLKAARVLRRRLDAARRVLDGELDA